jgi:hypothetical protein
MTAGPMVFVNIGWMKNYAGATADDQPVGGHGYLKDGNIGHEVFNFKLWLRSTRGADQSQKPWRGYVR